MKQFIVNRHTDPSNPTLDEVPTEKIPVYDTEADLDADFANLAEGQMASYPSEGANLSVPVDKVESGDMHAVTSNAVASALSYSETEKDTGKTWIDGKKIYRKVINIGTLPNTTSKTVQTGITYDTVVSLYAIAGKGLGTIIPIPYVSLTTNTQYNVCMYLQNYDLKVVTFMDMTTYTTSFAIIEYTKA